MTETNIHYTQKRNKQGEVKTRYHSIPPEAMPEPMRSAWEKLRIANQAAAAERAAFESVATQCSKVLTVNIEGYGEDLPLVPEGYAPVFGYQYGFGIGAVPLADKKTKGTTAKATVNFAKLYSADGKPKAETPEMPELPASLKREATGKPRR